MEHRKEDPKYKYGEQMRPDRQRKPDSLEQRSEEVRKLIEKPLPPPKPRQELTKEDYIASMMKPSHQEKYPSKYQEKPPHNSAVLGRNPGHEFAKSVPKPLNPPGHPQTLQHPQKDQKNGSVEEKRVKTEEMPQKHKSLFSPEKTPRETINRPKPKQKTPPLMQKNIKPERIPEGAGPLDFPGGFSTSPQTLQPPRRVKMEDEGLRVKMEDPGGYDLMNMFGKLPEPHQSLREPVSTNGRGASELKCQDVRFDDVFDKHIMGNGMDSLGATMKTDLDQLILDRLDGGNLKTEYLSPMKSAQGISALLQEPLAPMPSLLSHSTDSGHGSQPLSQLSQPINQESLQSSQPIKEDYLSTVDISVLSAPAQALPEVVVTAPVDKKIEKSEKTEKSEHRKSEKKKKKEKHKHKDKDKSKDKHKEHKHKHKEKDKDKKERNKGDEQTTEPIKITIPKDKLNLTGDTSTERKSPTGKLTLKIPKERLKPETMMQTVQTVQTVAKDVQGSLKIKISRTSGTGVEFPESRKRERERESGEGGPVSKKSANQGLGQVKTTERQNGRHYGSTSNKVRGGLRGGGRGFNRGGVSGFAGRDGYFANSMERIEGEGFRGGRGGRGGPAGFQGRTGQEFYYPYPPPNMYTGGFFCDPAVFYQQFQQGYHMYPQGNVFMTADGVLDTSVPPPCLPAVAPREELPPLPAEPPPHSVPPPPPPPPE